MLHKEHPTASKCWHNGKRHDIQASIQLRVNRQRLTSRFLCFRVYSDYSSPLSLGILSCVFVFLLSPLCRQVSRLASATLLPTLLCLLLLITSLRCVDPLPLYTRQSVWGNASTIPNKEALYLSWSQLVMSLSSIVGVMVLNVFDFMRDVHLQL